MPLFKTRSAAVFGIDAYPVDVEVDLFRSGMARDFMLVGMPDAAGEALLKEIASDPVMGYKTVYDAATAMPSIPVSLL